MMNALPEMLHCLNPTINFSGGMDLSVLERQQSRIKWQHDQHQQSFCGGNELDDMFFLPAAQAQALALEFRPVVVGSDDSGYAGSLNRPVKPDPGMDNGWPDYGKLGGNDDQLGYGYGNMNVNGSEENYAISRTASSSAAVAAAVAEAAPPVAEADNTNGRETVFPEKMSSAVGRQSFKKRKANKTCNQKVIEDEGVPVVKEKKIKGIEEDGESSKITTTEKNNNNCSKRETTSSNEDDNNSKISSSEVVQKPDYIHVRARRGQATDSHSLAERVRREKISERMKYLQDLVPGCNKITGKAGMLDEIINYVQSLQRQVEFLSMKLATANPRLDFNIDDLFTKEMFCASNFPGMGLSSEVANAASYLQVNNHHPLQQQLALTTCGLDLGSINSPPISLPAETFLNSSSFNQIQSSPATWDAETLQNLYNLELIQQGRSLTTTYPSHHFTGTIERGNLKMEM